MKKMRIAFIVCLAALICSVYSNINSASKTVELSRKLSRANEDLLAISEILLKTDLSNQQIEKFLQDQFYTSNFVFKKDTVFLGQVILIFKENKLNKILRKA